MSLTLALLSAHLLADFPLQTNRMAARKFEDTSVRVRHALVHQFVTQAFLLFVVPWHIAVGMGAVVSLIHFGIDTQRWAEPKENAEWYPVAVDQSLHITSLFVVSLVISHL